MLAFRFRRLAGICVSVVCAAYDRFAPRPMHCFRRGCPAFDRKIAARLSCSSCRKGAGIAGQSRTRRPRVASLEDSLAVKKAFAEGARKSRSDLDVVFADTALSNACGGVAFDEAAIGGTPNGVSCTAALASANVGLLVVMAGGAYRSTMAAAISSSAPVRARRAESPSTTPRISSRDRGADIRRTRVAARWSDGSIQPGEHEGRMGSSLFRGPSPSEARGLRSTNGGNPSVPGSESALRSRS